MNTLLTALFLASTVYGAVLFKDCCPYPALDSITSVNVSKSAFKCSEPIHLTCEKKDNYVSAAFTYNYTKGNSHTATSMDGEKVELDIACDHKSNLWRNVNPEGFKLYKSYGCTFMTKNGIWVIE